MSLARRTATALLLAVLLILSGCATRTPHGEASPSPSSLEESPAEENAPPQQPSSSAPKESSSEETKGLADPEIIETVTEIVLNVLERADLCDTIYRGTLEVDENFPPTSSPDGGEVYCLVMDGQFATTDDVLAFWSNTFTAEPISSERYNSINDRKVYFSMNQQLYTLEEPPDEPLTVGEWDTTTLKVLEYHEDKILVAMDTQLVGAPAGEQTLELKQKGGTWRLTDSYFLDQ